jgi:hypothetical protein
VGWLEREHAFATGVVDPQVYRRLVALLQALWEPAMFLGTHGCKLCRCELGRYGQHILFVPGGRVVYVCPELIAHYMNAHGYVPSDEFCQVLLRCPGMSTRNYFKALVDGGARALVCAGPSTE